MLRHIGSKIPITKFAFLQFISFSRVDLANLDANTNKERSRSDDPGWRLILCGFTTSSTLMSTVKQLPAEADPVKSGTQTVFTTRYIYTAIIGHIK